jgi:hypothetical protein
LPRAGETSRPACRRPLPATPPPSVVVPARQRGRSRRSLDRCVAASGWPSGRSVRNRAHYQTARSPRCRPRTSTRGRERVEVGGPTFERYQGCSPARRPRRREHLRRTISRITVAVHENAERPRLEIVGRERHTARYVHHVPLVARGFRGRDASRRANTVGARESRRSLHVSPISRSSGFSSCCRSKRTRPRWPGAERRRAGVAVPRVFDVCGPVLQRASAACTSARSIPRRR